MLDKKLRLIEKIAKYRNNYDIANIRDNITIKKNMNSLAELRHKWEKFIEISRDDINLYMHIPYCRSKCTYCREDSRAVDFDEDAYVDYLVSSLEYFFKTFSGTIFNTFYMGGGTPSILKISSLHKIFSALKQFKFTDGKQRTFECNPGSMTKEKLELARSFMINRISFGIQSTDETMLKNVNRKNPPVKKIKELIDYARELDFKYINADLIMGLFGDTPSSFIRTFKDVCEMRPKEIFIYPLNPTQSYLKIYYGDDIEKFNKWLKNLYDEVKEEIKYISLRHGYHSSEWEQNNSIGIGFYDKPNEKENVSYEYMTIKPSSCLGIGKRACSRIFGVMNYKDITNDEAHPVFQIEDIDTDFEIISFILRNLKSGRLDIDKFTEYFKIDFFKRYKNELDYLKGKVIEIKDKNCIEIITDDKKEIYKGMLMFLTDKQLSAYIENMNENLNMNENRKNIRNPDNKINKPISKVRIDTSGKRKAIMVSRLCNNHCMMCHSDTNYAPDYSTSEVLDAISSKIDGTEKQIQLSGGEPTIRKDLPAILRKIKELNPDAEIQINSNGRMFFYKDYLMGIKDNIDSVMTEIHGSNPGIHDMITQSKGSFEQTVQGIRNLVSAGIKIKIIVLVNKLNYENLPEIAEFIKKNFPSAHVSFHYTWFMRHAYKNREKLFVRVSETAPYLEKSVDILGDRCNIMHFPLCIFRPEYRSYVIKQGFVIDRREEYPLKECNDCSMKQRCRGIWNNYKNFTPMNEFSPIMVGNEKKASTKNFMKRMSDNRISLALSEIIGVKFGIRPLMMADQVTKEDSIRIKAFCNQEGLKCNIMKMKNYYRVYISKSQPVLEKGLVYSIKDRQKQNDDVWDSIKEIGLLFGYPECCVSSFIRFLKNNKGIEPFRERIYLYSKMKKPLPYLINTFNSSFSMINHIPCSSDCRETLDRAGKVHEVVKRQDPALYEKIIKELKYPIIAWNENHFVILKGEVKGSEIFYKDIRIPEIPEEDINDCYFNPEELTRFREGNRAVFGDKILIYNGNTLIHELEKGKAELLEFE